MFIDSLVIYCTSTVLFLKSKLVDQKSAKIDDIFGLSPHHVSSNNNGNKYEFINFVNTIK